jgi:UDP-glucuronate 4-epimerase
MKKIALTGSCGFIGFHLQQQLSKYYQLTGIDSLELGKMASIERSTILPPDFTTSIHSNFLDSLQEKPDVVIHLAAETGIAGSLTNPSLYFHQNVEGTFNVLEQCRKNGVKYLIYASSSSVYEPNQTEMHEEAHHDKQLSFYGTSKRMTEVMIENYCRQFGMVAIGLRFFTVYGSWTRPDMAAYKFMKAIDRGEKITMYNDGEVYRDFTHVSDIVTSIELLMTKIVGEQPGFHRVFNIGGGNPISVRQYATLIAENLGKQLVYESKPLPSNELLATRSNTNRLEEYIGYKPKCTIEEGIAEMVQWYKHRPADSY